MSEKQSTKPRLKLIELRKAAGLSQYSAATSAGCHRQTIIKLEKGEMTLTDEWIVKLAGAYGCLPGELIDDAPALSRQERDLLRAAQGLPEDMRAALLLHAQHLARLAQSRVTEPSEE